MQLDTLDQIAAKSFEGFIVRKDLVRRFKGQYPVPTYVAEFLLGRYCASTDEQEIQVSFPNATHWIHWYKVGRFSALKSGRIFSCVAWVWNPQYCHHEPVT